LNFRLRQARSGQTLALLGTTTRFSLFYDNEMATVLVVPVENISFMIK